MSFKFKVLGLSVMGIVLTGVIITTAVSLQKGQLRSQVTEEVDKLGRGECSKIAKDVWLMLRAHQASLEQELQNNLKVSRHVLRDAGKLSFDEDKVTWDAINQFTKQVQRVELPKMLVGGEWLGQVRDAAQTSPVVDEVKSLVGGTCTIFQRMNEQGDMLRVCTNVEKADGTRAIGTYIPAVHPDGQPNPVISRVLRGETYVGRAFVVNDWYITAYEPMRDAKNEIVGVLYFGIKQGDLPELRQGIMDIVPGKTGYVFVLGGSGQQKGKYIISHQGKRDGENIWEAKDAEGRLFIQSLVEKALKTENGESAFERYPWKNPGDETARWKVAAATYFEPWDWVIGAGAYEDDFQEALTRVDNASNQLLYWAIGGSILSVLLCGAFSQWAAHRISRPLSETVHVMEEVAAGDYTKRLDIQSKDEFGRMAVAINAAVEATETAMDEVKQAAERERQLQEERAEAERQKAEAERRRQEEEAAREKERMEEERLRKEEEAASERERMEEERRKADELRRKVDQLLEVVNAAAEGDLTREVVVEGDEAVDELAAGIGRMLKDLSEVIGQVTESATQFNEGSRVIAESSQSLAQGAQSQSASVEQMSASVEELTRSIDGVKERSVEADKLARKTSGLADRGGDAVQRSIEAMDQIKDSAQQISEIIQVISEIASQTNLLALNAAIEAARAGEHGMGFAVVADEVRKLAERSNRAAGEISKLIKESTERVAEGAVLSEETGKALKEIIEGVETTAQEIASIAEAAVQQAAGAQEVSNAIQTIAQVTEQNAAGSEEMASSSEELGAQAGAMKDLVARFRIR